MKLRINGNNIRLRLSPEDVETLCSNSKVSCYTKLLNGLFSYELKAESHWHAEVVGSHISVSIPESEITEWEKNETVGFEHRFDNGLFVLIEKDFQCLHPRKHEQEDHLYPNPEKQ